VLPIDHTLRPLGGVALGDLANPGAVVAGARGDAGGGLPLGQEPQHLPPAALMRLMRGAVALFELGDAEMRRQMNMSAHTLIV